MPIQPPDHILRAADVSEITQLILLERESRDQGRWKTMRACFHDDALIRISWITGNADDFVNGSIDMAKRGVLAKHRLGPVLVRVGQDRAVATLGAIIDIPVDVDGIGALLSSHARFFYRSERRNSQWKLSGFEAAYVRDELVPRLPGQKVSVTPDQVSQFRASYAMLSFVLSRSGYTVNSKLPGDDRPETVRTLEAEIFSWAGVEP